MAGRDVPAARKKTAMAQKKATSRNTPPTDVPKPVRETKSSAGGASQLKEYQQKRDFRKTTEPSGNAARQKSESSAVEQLHFVIQKHDASRLHYDLRLEMDGVMKSWAVPKGPSADPAIKRLAMQVEDHPIEYNTFEGTIPEGEYGGGTVMIWDHGTYEVENPPADEDPNSAAHGQYSRGEMKIIFHGKRIKGSYALVRTKGLGGSSSRPAWLLIKHRDRLAHPESESVLTDRYTKSVITGRTMDHISKGSQVWRSSN